MSENLGFLKVRGGDIPAALRLFAEALEGAGTAPGLVATHDRAEALLIAGMPSEARESLERRLDDVERAGFVVDLAEWHLLLAQAALMEGEAEVARASAVACTRASSVRSVEPTGHCSHNKSSSAHGGPVANEPPRCRAPLEKHTPNCGRRGGRSRRCIASLSLAVSSWRPAGFPPLARTLAQAAQARRRGPADLRAAAWYAEAMLRLASRDTRGATTALKAGLRVVDDHAASLGATDLRVHATGLGADLAEQGVRLAVESGEAGRRP